MKAHVGVDEETGLAHSVSATAANTHDVTEEHRGRKVDLAGRDDTG